ncbi:MAG: 16S rRNA (cytidine(1402)-2'-O)-methyltransferase [Ruminococcaceae bacterium]|nr:16S rRNA (cytidine(1402)-2'-O)-methyltransferase [Oscillospiraceae bacterium]
MTGTLYLCATPIGNLGDVSHRLLEVFNMVDLIACEDTRRTVQLLNYFDIHKQLTSYHEHNKREKGEYIVSLLKEGKNVALVSDAGTPAISDPGEDLVKLCIENDLNITSIPGCVAGVNALILSGLSTKRFAFEGFLSVNKRHRHEHLESVKNDTHTLIFYEAPHKLIYTLKDMLDILGNRKIALCRELTKLHEEIIRTTLEEAQSLYTEKSPKGEYVIIIEGAEKAAEDIWWQNITAKEHVEKYINDGDDPKDAIKKAAKDRNVPKRDVYNEFHGI